MGAGTATQEPIVLVIDFHHARGPEVEHCFCEDGTDPVTENDWSLLPFMALSDGVHTATEDFSYFTLKREATDSSPATSLFGISCSRQTDSASLLNRPSEITRSTVQKAVVAIINEPRHFGQLREKLSVVTSAWFAQRDFSDFEILKKFRESLKASLNSEDAQKDAILGLSLREMIHEFKHQTLVLFKCLLLQPKMLFFGSRCERLCMIQFSLISLMPGLIHNLEDCADPAFDSYAQHVEKPTSLKTSERSSLLAYMGLPLQIFGKGSMFGPYTPLQQLDLLTDQGTKSYVVGSTNSLLLQHKDRYSDIIIDLDEDNIGISSPSLRAALSLTVADRRWIDFLVQTINETWDEAHPEQPKTHGYLGSEEFIRLQFEEYLLALLSATKYHEDLVQSGPSSSVPGSGTKSPALGRQSADIEGDPALEFNADFLEYWKSTSNYALFDRLTSDALLFSVVEPRHPCSGGLGLEDIQRRITQQVADLHLDERVREGRETVQKHLATGQKKVSTAFNTWWADIEAMREAQRRKNEEKNSSTMEGTAPPEKELGRSSAAASPRASLSSTTSASAGGGPASWSLPVKKPPAVDMSQVQATAAAAGQRASAYFSSWSSWASDRRKEWQERRTTAAAPTSNDDKNDSRAASPTTPRATTSESIDAAVLSTEKNRRSIPAAARDQSHDTGKDGQQEQTSPPSSLSNQQAQTTKAELPSPTNATPTPPQPETKTATEPEPAKNSPQRQSQIPSTTPSQRDESETAFTDVDLTSKSSIEEDREPTNSRADDGEAAPTSTKST